MAADLLKSVAVLAKTICQVLQQKREQFGELEPLFQKTTRLEELISSKEKIEDHERSTFAILAAAFQRLHELLYYIEFYKRSVLFDWGKEMTRITNFVRRFSLLETIITQNDALHEFHFNQILINEPSSAFWKDHFGADVDVVSWEVFSKAFSEEYGEQSQLLMERVKHILCPHNKIELTIFDFGDFTDEHGLEESVHMLVKKKRSDMRTFQINTNDPLQPNSVWRGVCRQEGCSDRDIVMEIKQREEQHFEGIIYWCSSIPEDITGFTGDIISTEKNPQSDPNERRRSFSNLIQKITFEENSIHQGSGILPQPTVYQATIDLNTGVISGEWSFPGDNEQNGTFHLVLDRRTHRPTTQDLELEKESGENKNGSSSSSNNPLDWQVKTILSGWLTKKGGVRKNWKKRFFVLQRGIVTYYKSKESFPGKPTGRIEVSQMERVEDITSPASFSFIITTHGRRFELQADTEKEKQDWIAAVQSQINKPLI